MRYYRLLRQDSERFIALKPGILVERRVKGIGDLGLIGGFFVMLFAGRGVGASSLARSYLTESVWQRPQHKASRRRANSSCVKPVVARNSRGLYCKVVIEYTLKETEIRGVCHEVSEQRSLLPPSSGAATAARHSEVWQRSVWEKVSECPQSKR